jgi:predicted ATPase
MDDARWQRISALFAAALERDAAERGAFLGVAADPDVRHEVETLLAAHGAVGPLDRLAVQMESLRADALTSSTIQTRAYSDTGERPHAGDRAPLLEPGRRLGRHEIRARLGAGGMGEVYRAYDTRLQRDVAIKILGRRVQERPGALQRFEQEARAASALNHPNIITLYDIGEEEGRPYIVMELVEGESLRRMLSGPWPTDLLLHVARQIADGLVAAHERQIVHRDLKPENILLSRQGIAKIVDFGLAQFRLDQEAVSDRRAGGAERPLQGTAGYLAPEVIAGGLVDERSDQFSLGAILYEMATGRKSFPGKTSIAALDATLHDEPRPLSEARLDLPASFVDAVQRCLRKNPRERHASTRDFLAEIRGARRGSSAPAGAPPMRRGAALPAQRTRLIGRRPELEEIERLVLDKDVRLLTLTGPGGTGKTRLALEAAQRLSPRFPGGVFFVPLASITDTRLVVDTIAKAVGGAVTARPGLAGLIAELRSVSAPTLLLLDNFEQVLDAAAAVSELLAGCPDLTVLVTSREVLHLYGEHGFPVSPLELPDPAGQPLEALAEFPAVALFVERAQAANPGFRLDADSAPVVAALCVGLDGLPLALELAAAQVRVLTPEAMLSRLHQRLRLLTGGARDLPDRHQTLRRTIDWSHQLLGETEQAVFRRLAVFAAAFTVEAAQAVVDPYGTLGLSLEEGVTALVDKSLLQAREPLDGEPRFQMLETLRDYALEKLTENGEIEKTRSAHAAYFLVLAEEGSVAPPSAEQPRWLKRFEAEHDNFRAALEWLTRRGDADWGLRLALGLFPFWERGEYLAEGRRRFDALLELAGTRALPAQRAKALFAAGVLASAHGDLERGVALSEQCLELYRELDDRWGIVVALVALGNQYVSIEALEKARVAIEKSLDAWEELGEHTGFARSLSNLAFVARKQGRFDDARALYQKAVSMFERVEDRLSSAWARNHEGDVARDQGDLGAAESLYGVALASFRALGDGWGIASSLADLATTARQRGDRAAAGRLYREALGRFVELDHRRGIARLLESLACLAGEEGHARRGLQLAAAAAALRDRVGTPHAASVKAELEGSVARMERQLGADEARRAWQEGATLSLDAAVQLATTDPGTAAQ